MGWSWPLITETQAPKQQTAASAIHRNSPSLGQSGRGYGMAHTGEEGDAAGNLRVWVRYKCLGARVVEGEAASVTSADMAASASSS
jgi:hypothetical protein